MNLEDIALVNIAVTLWTSSEKAAELLNNYRNTDEWIHVTNVLCDHTSKLPLPEVIKGKIDDLFQFISFEIFKFIDYLSAKISLDNESLKYCMYKLSWKSQGVIDRKKSVKKLIGEPALSLSTRYKLACVFCFEEDILKLWNKLPDEERSHFLFIANQADNFLNNVSIWSLCNAGQEFILSTKSIEQGFESLSVFEFVCSVKECVPEGAEYYFKKIPTGERTTSIGEAMYMLQGTYDDIREMCASSHQYAKFYNGLLAEIVIFLFNETDNESIEIFADEIESYNLLVLECFLKWPFREFFIRIFEKLQPYFQEYEYIQFMNVLDNHILLNCTLGDDSYLLILKDVWEVSSKTNKESVYYFLPVLFSNILSFGDENLVLFILNDIPHAVREVWLFTDEGMVTCIELANKKNWTFLEIIVNKCLGNEKLNDFQSLFRNGIKMNELVHSYDCLEENDFETVFHIYNFMEDVIKERTINNIEPPAKRFHSDLQF